MIAPAVISNDKPIAPAMLMSAIPTVPAVVHELPMANDTMAHSTRLDHIKDRGFKNHGPVVNNGRNDA